MKKLKKRRRNLSKRRPKSRTTAKRRKKRRRTRKTRRPRVNLRQNQSRKFQRSHLKSPQLSPQARKSVSLQLISLRRRSKRAQWIHPPKRSANPHLIRRRENHPLTNLRRRKNQRNHPERIQLTSLKQRLKSPKYQTRKELLGKRKP